MLHEHEEVAQDDLAQKIGCRFVDRRAMLQIDKQNVAAVHDVEEIDRVVGLIGFARRRKHEAHGLAGEKLGEPVGGA